MCFSSRQEIYRNLHASNLIYAELQASFTEANSLKNKQTVRIYRVLEKLQNLNENPFPVT